VLEEKRGKGEEEEEEVDEGRKAAKSETQDLTRQGQKRRGWEPIE